MTFVVVKSTATAVFVAPVRMMVKVTFVPASATATALVVSARLLTSSSAMVMTLVPMPMVASTGPLRTTRKVSFVSCKSS